MHDSGALIDEVVEEVKDSQQCDKEARNLPEARYRVWIRRTGQKKVTAAPSLKSLPLTVEEFRANAQRAHFTDGNTAVSLQPRSPVKCKDGPS